MIERWRIEPEPTEEELAALTAAIVATLSGAIESEPESSPDSAWRRTARREAVEAGTGDGARWNDPAC